MSGYDQGRTVEILLNNTDPIAALGIIDWRGLSIATLNHLTTFSSRYSGKNRLGARLIDSIATEVWSHKLTGSAFDLYSVIQNCFTELCAPRAKVETLVSQFEAQCKERDESNVTAQQLAKQNDKLHLELLRTRHCLEIAEAKARDYNRVNDEIFALQQENEHLKDMISALTTPKQHWGNTAKDVYVNNSTAEHEMTYEDLMYSTARPKAYVKTAALKCLRDIDISAVDEDGDTFTIRVIS